MRSSNNLFILLNTYDSIQKKWQDLIISKEYIKLSNMIILSADPVRRAQSSSSYVESKICHKIQNPKSPNSKIQNPQNPKSPKSKIPQIWGIGGRT